MYQSKREFWCIFFVFSFISLQASQPGGLKFHGSEQPINQRTSYNVFGNKTAEFADYYAIEFKLSLYPTTEFGYILRIKNKESNRIYNLFYDGQGDRLTFKFNEEGKNNLIVANLNREKLLNMHWFKMKILFDQKGDSIKLTINDQTYSVGNEKLPETYYPVILFGKSDHIIDVPSFAIRDLSIGNQEKYFFPLNESKGNAVHDASGNTFGEVSNPEWLVNDAYHWRYKTSFKSQSVAGANYNPEKKVLYYYNRDTLYIYDVRSGETTFKIFDQQCPVNLTLGMNFIDAKKNKLYSYETYYAPPKDTYEGPTIASLDLETFQWTAENYEQLPSPLHHHGSYFNSATNQFTLFGGFGKMRYSKDFFTYDISTKTWDTLSGFTGDFLSPRYFSSVGYLKKTNSIYIFGGMGNDSGEQTVGRKYYYDLYKIDLNTKNVTKLWEIPWEQDNMVPVRGMVILDDSCFYTLCYPEHFSESLLKLYRFSLKDGQYDILGDSIPIHSDKITTNANLYYDSTLNNLFAVVQEFDNDISSDLKVYSLAFPPLTVEELATYSKDKTSYAAFVILLSFSLAIGIGYLIYRKKKTGTASPEDTSKQEYVPNAKAEVAMRANAIYLFGEFTVRDRNNKNITYMFSAQLKQIFCLILQYTTTEGGIASQRLSNILWPDKAADKVKNSRGVTINHLRKALSELDGIELVYDKGYFKIEQSDAFYCDYERCMFIISTNDIEKHRDELIEILSRGKFLQLSDHPLYDSLKEELEKKLEPVLLLEMEKSFNAELYPTTIVFAEAISNIDPLNDTALTFQIKAMQRLKMTDEARIRYQTFIIEYKKIMGTDYPHPYKNIIG
ncbi:DNA-binding transcriptional activator [Pseudochryseolinea flava]|uniref:DNA-binding transcriptional activator n=2 Tax=Pseudochryseolinea flava TaxID=2059302 RepID=A0A364Y6I5_9BACT|nr:DNA-binding transcriptional activator [Pseudochryseolinea flava]